MRESDLVKMAKSGDKEAFCRLYSLYKDRLYRYAYYRLGNYDDAQDAVSDCIVSAYEQIKNLRKAEAFPSWIFKILYAACSTYIKQQMRQRELDDIDTAGRSSNLFTIMDESKTELAQALDILSSDEKEIFFYLLSSALRAKRYLRLRDLLQAV